MKQHLIKWLIIVLVTSSLVGGVWYWYSLKSRPSLPSSTNTKSFPLSSYLPYTDGKYELTYLRENTLLVNPLQSFDKTQVLKEIKEWVKAQNVDPESHSYVFIEARK